MLDDYYDGITHLRIAIVSDNSFQADKFMPIAFPNNEQWTFDIHDFRYIVGDDINIFTMIEDASHTITWDNLYDRTLDAVSMTASLFVAGVTVAALTV